MPVLECTCGMVTSAAKGAIQVRCIRCGNTMLGSKAGDDPSERQDAIEHPRVAGHVFVNLRDVPLVVERCFATNL
jgi:hypothetical protein